MNTLSEIITWASKSLPKWQQLIVKNILQNEEFDSAKIDNIIDSALEENELADDILKDLIYSEKTSSKVRLVSVTELNNINNLKDGESLDFDGASLTVVYGQNGAGKSGYSRIIKTCCRSRDDKAQILGNIHDPSNKNQSAKISYLIEDEQKSYVWGNATPVPPELQLVHVFDRKSGDIFLSKDADIQYRPYGMDILDKLSEILPWIEKRLQERSSSLQITDIAAIFQNEYPDTIATKLVENLGVTNARELYDELSKLSEEELLKSQTLSESISKRETSSPATEREKFKKRNSSLRSVKVYYSALLSILSEQKKESLNTKITELLCAKKNADDAKKLTFDEKQFLSGTGNATWKTMWRAAEAFSKDIGKEYPPTQKGSKCVLCQQTLDAEHVDIMARFKEYVNDESQNLLTQCQLAIEKEVSTINDTLKNLDDEANLLKAIEDDFSDIYDKVNKYVLLIRTELSKIMDALKELHKIQVDDKAYALYKELETTIVSILAENEEKLQNPLNDEDFKKSLSIDKAKLNDFKARQALKKYEKSILKNIDLLPLRICFEAIEKQCGTTNVSRKTTELSKKYIVDQLSKSFNDELKDITNSKIEAILVPSGTKQGTPYSKIVLKLKGSEEQFDKIIDVLSEGELRGVSLAGFFAELAITHNHSAIVFDDPVSSLDHVNAGRIADRIVKEAKTRQIIVFTHDILFVSYIMERLEKGQAVSYKQVSSLNKAGIVEDGLPFDKMTVKERIGKLKTAIQEDITRAYKDDNTQEYRRLAEKFYKDLRMTWERAVEEILFGDVVRRFSHDISTQRLREVKYTPENADIITKNMTLCSSKLLHDPASSEDVNLGTPENLSSDLKILENFRKDN